MRTRGPRLSLERALALLGLIGLFMTAGIAASMIAGATDKDVEDTAPTATEAATPTPKPKRTPKPTPTPVPLTSEERAQRRAAAELVRGQGFDPVSVKAYHPDQTLRVILGETSAATRANGVAAGRRAFFFVGDSFIETDAQEPSASLRVVRQTENTVTLGYGLTDRGQARVRFRWDGGSLAAQSPVPPFARRQQ